MLKMILRLARLSLSMLLLVSAGCQSTVGAADNQAKETGEPPHFDSRLEYVRLEISGGLAGIQRSVTLQQDGKLTVKDDKQQRELDLQIKQQKTKDIYRLIPGKTESSAEKPSLPGGRCADCIVYQLTIGETGKPRVIRLDSVSLNKSPYRKVIEQLVQLMNKEFSGK